MQAPTKPKTIAEYIDAAPKAARKKLLEMRACLREIAPEAEESLKWGVPAFSSKRILFTFAARKDHIGFYPTPSAVETFSERSRVSKRERVRSSFHSTNRYPCPSFARSLPFVFAK